MVERRQLERSRDAFRLTPTRPECEATNWDGFRVEAIPWRTYVKRNLIHLNLLGATLRRARGAVLEVGVGSGALSALMSWFHGRTMTIDNDARILGVARRNLERYGRGVLGVRGDAFALPFHRDTFAVAFSQGLMEHFSDDSIALLLREQLRVARSVVFSVPSDHYPRQDVGDERLMSPDAWSEIVQRGVRGAYRVRASYYRLDLEAAKYSLLARRRLGSFSVLVTVDPLAQDR
ncbi:MAG: class I SAM-dependent methyltransferase [bacterium]